MPTFIDMSALTKRMTLTGNEEFQVSATEKVTAQQIADLASTGIQTVTVTNFKTNIWNDDSGSNVFSSVPEGGMVVFKSAADATSGPGEALIGYAIKSSSLMASYVGMTRSNGVGMIPTLYTNKSSSIYDTKWQKLPDDSNVIAPIEVTDFSLIGESLPANLTPGMAIPFTTTGDVNNKPSGTDTSYTGIMVVADTQKPIVNVMAWGSNSGACFFGVIDVSTTTVTWNNNRLSVAKGTLSAFTETAITSYFQEISDGDLMPFLTPQSNKTTANQFPANGAWSGFITIGNNGGLNIIAFNSATNTNPEVYVGRCSGSTTQWTAVGGGGVVPPVQITEYGAFFDYTELNNVPAGSVTAWYAPGSIVDGDMGPFKGMSEHTEGIYIAIKGSEDDTYREGIMVAYRADGEKGMAYAHIQGTPGSGGITYATDWMTIDGNSSSGDTIPVGTTLWAGEVSLNDDAPDIFDFPRGLKNGDILTIMYDLYVESSPNSFFVTGINAGCTFDVVVGEERTGVQFGAFYNAGGNQGGVISENGIMDINCTTGDLTFIVRGGETYPVGNRITIKRIYKSANNNPDFN